jgi:hypothetical protein
MKNKINTLFIIFIIFVSNNSFSQLKERYEKGSITTSTNQIILGHIKNDDFKHKVTSICFKTSLNEKNCKKYDISNVISFKTEYGEIYSKHKIKINNLTKEVTLFAKKLVDGSTSLYKSLYDDLVFYIVTKDDETYVLQNDRLISGDFKVSRYNYVGILNQITEDFSIENTSNIEFKEQYFIDRISKYNASKKNKYKVITTKEKPVKFITLVTGLGFGKKNKSEYFMQLNKRIYYPKFSKNISLNIGVNYYYYQFTERNSSGTNLDVTQTLLSIPCQIQYNFANKSFRPYVFTGANFGFFNKKDENGNSLIEDKGFQGDFGLSFLLGAGLEIDVYKGFYLKGEFRHENFNHLFLLGLGYIFKL